MLRADTTLDPFHHQQGANDMAEEVLKVTRHPNYAVLTLNRPEKRNALNQPLIDALNNALVKFESDREIRALLIRGEGAHFCAGIDLKEVDETTGSHNPTSLESVFGRLERFPVPTIAAPVSGADHRGYPGRRARRRSRAGAALRSSNRVGMRHAGHDARPGGLD